MPALSGPFFAGRSYTLDAEVTTGRTGASAAIVAVGSHHAGWSLLLDRGRPLLAYALSDRPDETYRIAADTALGAGPQRLRLILTSEGFVKGAAVDLASGGTANSARRRRSRAITRSAGRRRRTPRSGYGSPTRTARAGRAIR